MPDDYYQLARKMEKLSRQDLATELRKFHQQITDQATEYLLNLLGQAEEEGWSTGEIRENVRKLELRGKQIANDRLYLRRCEAVLFALRNRKAIIVSKNDVAAAYDSGNGVEIDAVNATALEVTLHPGKFTGD